MSKFSLKQIGEVEFDLPRNARRNMQTEGKVFASKEMLEQIEQEALEQVANVATLPGIVGYALGMPDIHSGYGFPIGGVAAMDMESGVVSPGGVGYDINCGVRLLKTPFLEADIEAKKEKLIHALFEHVPSGTGVSGFRKVKLKEMNSVLLQGMSWAIEEGYGLPEDQLCAEQQGCLQGADPEAVSQEAKKRGSDQLGTLGAGNHFLEVQVVEKIMDTKMAHSFGLFENQIVVMIHTGSRGLGHQVCSDFLKIMGAAMAKYKIEVPDRQLACIPIRSKEGQAYLSAMRGAANFAFANREVITHLVREAFRKIFSLPPEQITLLYDVCHNIAKEEQHVVKGKKRKLLVHRKGATRAFPSGHPELPEKYRSVGQPVIIPGDMGRNSYVLVGTEKALEKSFGSTCHGAGRRLSRHQARKKIQGKQLLQQLREKGIFVQARNKKLVSEEAPEAYKDVNDVVAVCEKAGLSRIVARLRPVGCVKG